MQVGDGGGLWDEKEQATWKTRVGSESANDGGGDGGCEWSSLDPSELNACAKEGMESTAARSLVAGGMLAQQSVHSDGFRSRQSWSEVRGCPLSSLAMLCPSRGCDAL